jgi:hypothetical protein
MSARVLIAGLLAALIPCLAQGCVADNPRPGVSPASRQPEHLRPARLVLVVSTPTDSDANGSLDTIPVAAYLFGDSPRYALPVWLDGSITFTLTAPAGGQIWTWSRSIDEVRDARRMLRPFGRGHLFALSILDHGPDEIPATGVDLTAEFISAEGLRVRPSGPSSTIIGRSR